MPIYRTEEGYFVALVDHTWLWLIWGPYAQERDAQAVEAQNKVVLRQQAEGRKR